MFDCTKCGACCTSESYGGGLFVTVYGADTEHFSALELAPDTQGCGFLRTKAHAPDQVRCLFLNGNLGENCTCTAYTRRPQVCHDFQAGSPECLAIRVATFGPEANDAQLESAGL